MSKQISIIGCGWLGLPLARHLIEKHHKVKGSTTSFEKLRELTSFGMETFQVKLTNEAVFGDIEDCLVGSEILILNVPPGLRKHPDTNFVKQIELLVPYIEASTIRTLVFISSTSVYADEASIPLITEKTEPNPNSETGKQLLEIEKLLKNNKKFKTTIIRFGGLFGKERHPANSLSGRTNLKNPEAPVNLIHLDDCIGIITSIIEKGQWNQTFNASTVPHPSRKTYYTSVCKRMHLPDPVFEIKTISKGKLIDNSKLVQTLGYDFKIKL